MTLTRPAIYDPLPTEPADLEILPPTDAVPEELTLPGDAPEDQGSTAERSK